MTDRDRSLQEAFDRHLRGEGPLPDAEADPDAAAYQLVYAALNEEPEGELPNDFAERVANRVGLTTEPIVTGSELFLLVLTLAGLAAAVAFSPSLVGTLMDGLGSLTRIVEQASASLRLDVLLATGFVLVLTLLFDSLLSHWRPVRRAFST